MCIAQHTHSVSYVGKGVAQQGMCYVFGLPAGGCCDCGYTGGVLPVLLAGQMCWEWLHVMTQEVTLQLNEAKNYHGDHGLSLPDARLPGNNVCVLF